MFATIKRKMYEQIRSEGIAEGREEGIAEGRVETNAEWQAWLDDARMALRRLSFPDDTDPPPDATQGLAATNALAMIARTNRQQHLRSSLASPAPAAPSSPVS